ncbi:TPA: ferrous iron transport protein A [Candidatus Micrarchaeota archaeon]|nr:ferrous iron transport protein A [Candidatus Micrarchaeota archaeon]
MFLNSFANLESLPPGSKAVVVRIEGGRGLVARLSRMGIVPGTEVRVVFKAPVGGPILVEVNGAQVALGRGVARKVVVRPHA